MKILVLSMLRIGDLFMQQPILQALKKKHPEAQIDLVVNSVSGSAALLLKDLVSKTYIFSRDEYQRSAREAHFNIFWGTEQIDQFIDELSSQNYDQILNLTHNKLSAFLAGAIPCRDRRGLYFENGQMKGLESAWMQYFNDHFPVPGASVFHYTELLANAFDLEVERTPIRRSSRRSGLILFQCFTSEDRKNWPATAFLELKQKLEEQYPFYIIRVIATEKERSQLQHCFTDEEIWITDFEMTESILKEARLLVGVDTSIKHLAALCGTPVVEVALGGSDAIKTGAFVVGARSVQGAERVSVDDVFNEVRQELEGTQVVKDSDHDLECERWIWRSYLNNHMQMEVRPQANAGYIARSFKFLEWQLRLEKSLTENSNIYLKERLEVKDIQDFVLIAQEILKANNDHGSYFKKLIETLSHAGSHGPTLYSLLDEAISQSRTLIKLRSLLVTGDKDVEQSREASAAGA